MDEERLVDLARSGDVSAFESLVEEYDGRIYNMAFRMLGNPEDARDVTQETFLKAYSSLSRFRGDSSFSTWVYRIAKNACLDFLRRRSRGTVFSLDQPLDTEEGELERQVPGDLPDPEEVALDSEVRRAVSEAIANLPPHHRSIIVLRDIEDLSYEEIAEVLEVELGTVKSRLYRARTSLSRVLGSSELFRDRGVGPGERRDNG
ncbi:MAG: sigma-70 family RNA polymerase sigma factor [Bacillota bacterium]